MSRRSKARRKEAALAAMAGGVLPTNDLKPAPTKTEPTVEQPKPTAEPEPVKLIDATNGKKILDKIPDATPAPVGPKSEEDLIAERMAADNKRLREIKAKKQADKDEANRKKNEEERKAKAAAQPGMWMQYRREACEKKMVKAINAIADGHARLNEYEIHYTKTLGGDMDKFKAELKKRGLIK